MEKPGLNLSGEVNKADSMSNIETTYPLSPMQEAMLFHYQLAPESGIYIQQLVGSLHEDLNITAFKKSWDCVALRHEVLRTAFRWEGLERPLQDVYSRVNIACMVEDWQDLSDARQKIKFEEFLESDRKSGVNLAKAPVMRLSLFRLGKDSYKFIWTYHHIIVDGRSRQVVIDEVFDYYDTIRQGKDLSLPPPRQYREYVDWSQQQDILKSENYWRTLLKGFLTPNHISSSRTSGFLDETNRTKAEAETGVSESVTSRLSNIARENRLTLNTIVQGAWALLLNRYCNEDDIVFGVVRAGRHWTPRAGNMVGLFVYTVPTRVKVSQKTPLISWLKEIRQQLVEVREHEATPLIDIQKWSDVLPGKSLFESIFVYYEMETFFWSKEGKWEKREFNLIEDNGFPITVDVYAGSNILLKLTYDKQHFNDATIKRMLGHLKTLLEGMAEAPEKSLEEFPVLTEAERRQIMVEWNDTGVEYPQDRLIHQIFEAQAEKTPDKIAVVYEGKNLTYRELNQRANQLAHYLQSIGVGPESLVGIAVERSPEMIVGLYGILKAGGAYVPIDPTYPAERIAYMIEDADAPVLLTQQTLLEKLPHHKARVVRLDADWEGLIAGQDTKNPACKVTLDNLAYVIYTSGSTGKPKGSMNTHAGILNRLLWMQDTYRLTASDAVLQKTPFSFDVSVWEFFWPLMFGARLVVARPEGHRDSDYLVRTITEQQITTMHFVPSMLQVFLMATDVEKCVSLRQVICSGEALPMELQKRFFARLKAKLHNLYGPTEAAVDVTFWECQPETDLTTVPIGRPVANTRIYILDGNMQPVPVGVPGELFIGGVQVGRGYWNRAELTAEKFVPDPFGGDPKTRLYRTGDSCYYLPDGNIEYLGRLDFQVKIRGNRVELGEIEALLSQHPAVREVVVLVREDIPNDKRIVAYITANQNQKITTSEVRDYIKEKLPDFMVPAYFIVLDRLPLTPNQKIDRQALPAPDALRVETAISYIPPGNKLQESIAEIWQEILNVPRVGMNDNFFELGGHSLLIVRVYYRLKEMIDREISITDMFRFPTINSLTDFLSKRPADDSEAVIKRSTERAMARREAVKHRLQIKQRVRGKQ
jgi:amino acid adenylation domain-containing protein